MMVKVVGFDWDEANIEKCQKHGVSITMIEEFFNDDLNLLTDVSHSTDEDRHIAIGRIPDGRAMFVGFTYRLGKRGLLIRPITARFMHKREIQKYEKAFAKI